MSADIEKVWGRIGPEAILLAPLGVMYGLGWIGYKLVYDLGFKRSKEPHFPVVCIGSMIAGGAGKTPVTRHIVELIQSSGRTVVIGMSGYRSQRREGATLAPPGPLDAAVWGDETSLMRLMLPEVPLVVGKDRVAAAKAAHHSHPESVLVMDDGFQHLPVKKHLQIVLDPPDLKNRMCIPAGPYREFWSLGKRRADLVLPGNGFRVAEAPLKLLDASGTPADLPSEAHVLCAIGRPKRFVDSIRKAGVKVSSFNAFGDHADLTGPEVFAGLDPRIPIVTTGKDWVKLRERRDLDGWTLLTASHEVTIEPRAEFAAWLLSRLDLLTP